MNDEKFRLALHAAADECLSGVERAPSQRAAVFSRISGRSYVIRRRKPLVPVIALLMVLAIAGAAAAGFGLFGRLRAQKVDEMSYTRLAHLEDAAVSVGQTAELGGGAKLTIDQAYCDGRRLYYSYTLETPEADAKIYVGDGAKLTDGTYMNPVDSGTERVSDTVFTAYYEVEMPEGYAAGETVEFVLTVIDQRGGEAMELTDLNVRVPVTGTLRGLTGEGTADGYAAIARLYVSDVDVSGSVRIEAPVDYYPEGYALAADGVTYRNIDEWWEYDGQAHVLNLRFDLPETMESLVLMPLDLAYAHEAIELKGE